MERNMKKHILLVEDDFVLLEIMQKYLAGAGYDIAIAQDGAAALEALQKEVPDLVLLDIILPKLDGFGVLKAMRDDPRTAKTKVVILSNLSSDDDIRKGMEFGVIEYIIKAEKTPDEIVETVNRVLGAK